MDKKLTRSLTDRKISGVCGGLGRYFDIDSNLVRILWLIFGFTGAGIIVYFIAAALLPEE